MYRNGARWTLLLGAVALVALASTGPAAAQDMTTTTVTVVNGTGDPVSDVELSATWDGGGPVNETTRANGQALVDVEAGAEVTFRIHDDEYVRNEPFVVENATGGEVEIPVSRAGSIEVTAVDADGVVADPIVQLRRDDGFVVNVRAGSDGIYQTRDIEQGEYELRVYKAGYLRNTSTIDVDGHLSREVRIEEDSRTLNVTVVDDYFDDPRPVRDATVELPDVGSVQTLSNGEATISVPVNDEYDVTVSKDGYETNTTSVRIRESSTSLRVTIQRTPGLDLETANERVVVGESVGVTVTNEYGERVDGASIAVDGEDVAETDPDGEANVPIESGGTRNLTASYGDLTATASVEGIDPDGDQTPTSSAETTTDGGTTPNFGPGFSTLAALAALLGVGALLGRR